MRVYQTSDAIHWLRKLWRTVTFLPLLGMARMFGHYEYSSHDECDYARYRWRGKSWIIPTSPVGK